MPKTASTWSAAWPVVPALLALAVVAVPKVVAYLSAWLIVAMIVGILAGQILRSRDRQD